MKICFITEDFYPDFIGGQGIYGKNLVENLAKKNVKVTVFAEDRGERKKYWRNKKNIKLILVPFCFGNQLVLAFLEYLSFIIYERNNYYDVVHANQLSGLLFALFKPNNVKKVVLSIHNTNYDMFLETKSLIKKILYQPLIFLERLMYRHIEGLLFCSPAEEEAFKKNYLVINKPLKIVYLGHDSSFVKTSEDKRQMTREKVRKALNLSKDAKIILYVGRIVKRKKVETLVRAANNIYNYYKNYNIYILVIGQGNDLNHLKATAPPNVKFLGFVEDTKNYYLASDLFVLTSVAEGGFSLSVLEAASYGLPLIVSPSVAGFPIIEDGRNGYIVNSDDSKNLAEKIISVLKQQEEFSQESLKRSKNFTWEKCTKATAEFYQSLLEKPVDIV